MASIRKLDPHVAELIAAGEVVERPASVVKELVENAMDAGASAIVVEIRRGGMGLIRVTDNGCGIPASELPTAFLRHATSKLRTAADLEQIGTLGFRGEALAAISAVSRTEILTRTQEASLGASLTLEGGVSGRVEEAGAPVGTSICVRDLFYNTPARMKFMKKDSAETAAVNGLMQHLALSHPEISFRFLKDGTEVLHTPGDGNLLSAIYAAQGRDFAQGLIPVEGCGGDTAVSGFVTAPLKGRGSRSMQTFFVNGRFIKSQLLTAALEEAYRNRLMKGKFPGCVLSVTLPAAGVDVNVHPAKTQVKFAREQDVFHAVYYPVKDALDQERTPEPSPAPAEQVLHPRQDFFRQMDAKTFREQQTGKADPVPPITPKPAGRPALDQLPSVLRTPAAPASGRALQPRRESIGWNTELRSRTPVADSVPKETFYQRPQREEIAPPEQKVEKPFSPAIPQDAAELPGQERLDQGQAAPWRIAGEILHTYIICEDEAENVWLIDKHAAHERVNFDRLMASQEPPMSQTLLQPVAAELGREDAVLLLEHLPLLERLGFTCEDFGDGTILVREVPADLDAEETASTLEAFAEDLRSGRSPQERRENLLHTMACKAAIKGGWTSDPAELQVLVEKVQSGEIQYCPHGRPVAVKIRKYELEKRFRRA